MFLCILLCGIYFKFIFAENHQTKQQKATTTIQIRTIQIKKTNPKVPLVKRDTCLTEIRTTLLRLISESYPKDLNSTQMHECEEQTKWLKSIHERLSKHQEKLQNCLKQNLQINSVVRADKEKLEVDKEDLQKSEMTNINNEFLTLQNSIQMESRKFLILSNTVKVRHDIAMSSIRNMK